MTVQPWSLDPPPPPLVLISQCRPRPHRPTPRSPAARAVRSAPSPPRRGYQSPSPGRGGRRCCSPPRTPWSPPGVAPVPLVDHMTMEVPDSAPRMLAATYQQLSLRECSRRMRIREQFAEGLVEIMRLVPARCQHVGLPVSRRPSTIADDEMVPGARVELSPLGRSAVAYDYSDDPLRPGDVGIVTLASSGTHTIEDDHDGVQVYVTGPRGTTDFYSRSDLVRTGRPVAVAKNRRAQAGDRVVNRFNQQSDDTIAQGGGRWHLAPHAVATVVFVDDDGDFILRNPEGKTSRQFKRADHFRFHSGGHCTR